SVIWICGASTARVAEAGFGVALPASLDPLTSTLLVRETVTEGSVLSSAARSTTKKTPAVEPTAIAPVYVMVKPVRYWPAETVGVVGMVAALVKSGDVGAVPVLTDHRMVASVAPTGHELADVNPPKVTSGVKKLPPDGSATVMVASGPL